MPRKEILTPADFRGKSVRVVTVIAGERKTADPDNDQTIMRAHVGAIANVVKIRKHSVKLEFANGDAAWALLEEISLDFNNTRISATVYIPPKAVTVPDNWKRRVSRGYVHPGFAD